MIRPAATIPKADFSKKIRDIQKNNLTLNSAMKKISLISLGLMTATCAMAQQSLVKEVERNLKSAPETYPAEIQKLQPAFTDTESATDAYTWFVAGKGAVDFFDNQQVLLQMGKGDVDKKAVGHALVDGFGYFEKALPLDSVVDQKGKVKTKYSKKIKEMAQGHYLDLQNAAVYMWDAEDYPGAVEAWQLFVDGRNNPLVAEKAKQFADTVYGNIYYNMGIGNSLAKNPEAALNNFKQAIATGYTEKNAFDYGIAAAAELQNPAEMAALAEQAYKLYGEEDARYIGYIINNYIDKKQFSEANALLDKYLIEEPNNSQLYYVKGVLCDTEGKTDECLAAFRKAVQLDDKNARAFLQLGYQLCKQGDAIDEAEGAGLSNADYSKLRATKIDPLYKEAAQYLENAYSIDNELDDARTLLRSIYYKLNDEENLKRVENM